MFHASISKLKLSFNEYLYQIERGTIKLPLRLKETAKRVLYAFLDYWNNPPS
jgi:hypothetical protein